MSAQVEIGYIDHFDDTFDYSYSGEALSYPKICELHHCVPGEGWMYAAFDPACRPSSVSCSDTSVTGHGG